MGQFANTDESFTLEEQIKSLGDDELLDFWEETQHLTRLMAGEAPLGEMPLSGAFSSDVPTGIAPHPEYERLILQELQVRSSRGVLR